MCDMYGKGLDSEPEGSQLRFHPQFGCEHPAYPLRNLSLESHEVCRMEQAGQKGKCLRGLRPRLASCAFWY